MSDQGEKTCPLCAEEMDLTDQQLKPCKCGYEICVWCWHHIMEMAEKDVTEGRCPACRTPYNKEKIVGMTPMCERFVEKKSKSQKPKNRTSEGRKQLGNVRVIQRNLVYIVGLPLNLADEDLLQRDEYFGQYGKVLKVSISRTAAGTIQQCANNTCSVYITYSKENEAVRCIQYVHGFVLEGRSLRWAHIWLALEPQNIVMHGLEMWYDPQITEQEGIDLLPCSNSDCLYLHDIGSQEDSFTKDEIISAYTRSRVQQIAGATNNMQQRSGNVLPPPADEYCNNGFVSSRKPINKSGVNNSVNNVRDSPPNSSSGDQLLFQQQPHGMPLTYWKGTRALNNQPPLVSLGNSNGPLKQKPDACNGSLAFSMGIASPTQVSILHADVGKKLIPNGESHTIQQNFKAKALEPMKQDMGSDRLATVSETPATPGYAASSTMNSQLHYAPACKDEDKCSGMPPNVTNSIDLSGQSCGYGGPGKDVDVADKKIQKLCSYMSSLSIDRSQGSPQSYVEQLREPLTFAAGNAETSTKDNSVARELSDFRSHSETHVAQAALGEVDDDSLFFDDRRLKDPEVVTSTSYLPNLSHSSYLLNQVKGYYPQYNEDYSKLNVSVDPLIVDKKFDISSPPQTSSIQVISNGYPENLVSSSAHLDNTFDNSYMLLDEEKRKHIGRLDGEVTNVDSNAALDTGESSIISNILSMDFDSWDDSLTSPQNLARLLGETDKQQGSLRVSSSWKVQSSNQSRFSFAREEDSTNQNVESSLSYIGQPLKNRAFSHDFVDNRDFHLDKLGNCNGFSSVNCEEFDNFASSQSHLSSGKPSGEL
ncbi:unnamed protein product [Ilex paraguariensis]|uniref:CCR4-NOT transcription complex subunit 4 n=1 Tax=Ilex paraguariensis TaxID=185542 RepID=A0ABC8U880_9AQUA